jgi:hypothetical protein
MREFGIQRKSAHQGVAPIAAKDGRAERTSRPRSGERSERSLDVRERARIIKRRSDKRWRRIGRQRRHVGRRR